MTKQEKFLWLVQTSLLVNVNHLARHRSEEDDWGDISYTGNEGTISDAIRASERIPDDMSVEDAAHEYCSFMFKNLREADEAEGTHVRCPEWFMRT